MYNILKKSLGLKKLLYKMQFNINSFIFSNHIMNFGSIRCQPASQILPAYSCGVG